MSIQILSDSSKSIVTEKGTRSPYDKMIFNSSPSIEVKKRHTCSSTQGSSNPMLHTASFSASSSTSSYALPEHSYSAPTLTLYGSNIVDAPSEINIDSKPQQNNGSEITATPLSERKFLPSDLPKLATHFIQEPTVSSEFLKKKSQHQRVASDDSLASLTALPSPATSVHDFPIAHSVRHFPPVRKTSSSSLNTDGKNYPHHPSHFEGHDHPKEDHHIDHHHISDNGPISDHHALQRRLSKFGLSETTELIGHYAILEKIGEGAFSEVKLAIDLNNSSHVAIKMIAIKGIEDSERLRSSVLREVEILKSIDHPNIVRLLNTVETSTHLCLILEYVPGGELFDYVNDHYEDSTEEESKRIFLQLVNILGYLHENDIVHRDLKLENILTVLPNKSPNGLIIKLTDFGLAKFIDRSSPTLNTRCGSEEYAAPELLSGKPYDGRKTDLWSLGVILYALLVGYLPFNLEHGQLRRQFLSKILRADFIFPNSEKETGRKAKISNEAKDLVKKILHNNPQKRLNLDEIKNHSWLKSVTI